MARDDDAFLGLHHGAFEVPDMEAENEETPDDCMAQVKRVKATRFPRSKKLAMTLVLDAIRKANWLRLHLCNRTLCLRER